MSEHPTAPERAKVGPAAALNDLRHLVTELREKLLEVAGGNCPDCQHGETLTRDSYGRWWHELEDDEGDTEKVECESYGIHEALYQFDQGREAKDV